MSSSERERERECESASESEIVKEKFNENKQAIMRMREKVNERQ